MSGKNIKSENKIIITKGTTAAENKVIIQYVSFESRQLISSSVLIRKRTFRVDLEW